MKIEGMPETFWVVTALTSNSEMGDVCFESDFRRFALQVRGGLDVEGIVGVYASEQAAQAMATKLLAAVSEKPDPASVTHSSPWLDWYATQENSRSVLICNRVSEEKIQVEPPVAWGKAWAWNVNQFGTGIVMRRVA